MAAYKKKRPIFTQRKPMKNLSSIKALVPDYAKDAYLDLDIAVLRSEFSMLEALGIALAAAFAAKSRYLVNAIKPLISKEEADAALAAASIASTDSIHYPYTEISGLNHYPATDNQSKIKTYLDRNGISQQTFELFALAASIVSKCKHSIQSHYQSLKKDKLTDKQLKNVGEIAAAVYAIAHVIAVEQ